MANGLQGLELGVGQEVITVPSFGMKGVSIELIDKQYISPKFGLIGIEFNIVSDVIPPVRKIIKA